MWLTLDYFYTRISLWRRIKQQRKECNMGHHGRLGTAIMEYRRVQMTEQKAYRNEVVECRFCTFCGTEVVGKPKIISIIYES